MILPSSSSSSASSSSYSDSPAAHSPHSPEPDIRKMLKQMNISTTPLRDLVEAYFVLAFEQNRSLEATPLDEQVRAAVSSFAVRLHLVKLFARLMFSGPDGLNETAPYLLAVVLYGYVAQLSSVLALDPSSPSGARLLRLASKYFGHTHATLLKRIVGRIETRAQALRFSAPVRSVAFGWESPSVPLLEGPTKAAVGAAAVLQAFVPVLAQLLRSSTDALLSGTPLFGHHVLALSFVLSHADVFYDWSMATPVPGQLPNLASPLPPFPRPRPNVLPRPALDTLRDSVGALVDVTLDVLYADPTLSQVDDLMCAAMVRSCSVLSTLRSQLSALHGSLSTEWADALIKALASGSQFGTVTQVALAIAGALFTIQNPDTAPAQLRSSSLTWLSSFAVFSDPLFAALNAEWHDVLALFEFINPDSSYLFHDASPLSRSPLARELPLNHSLKELIVLALINLGGRGLDTALPLIPQINAYNVGHVVRALLWHVSPSSSPDQQTLVLSSIAAADNVWRFEPLILSILAESGLPPLSSRQDLIDFLPSPPSPHNQG